MGERSVSSGHNYNSVHGPRLGRAAIGAAFFGFLTVKSAINFGIGNSEWTDRSAAGDMNWTSMFHMLQYNRNAAEHGVDLEAGLANGTLWALVYAIGALAAFYYTSRQVFRR